jgi:hypothetical protein
MAWLIVRTYSHDSRDLHKAISAAMIEKIRYFTV